MPILIVVLLLFSTAARGMAVDFLNAGAKLCRQLVQRGGDGSGLRQHRIVSALEIAAVPSRRTGSADEPLIEVGLQGRSNERPRQCGGGARAKLHWFVEAEQWMRCQPRLDPGPDGIRQPLADIASRGHSPSLAI
jgi:hypothetical protein